MQEEMTTPVENIEQDPPYRKRVYSFLSENLAGFDRTEDEFYKKLDTEKDYADKVYKALSDNASGFTRPKDEFIKMLELSAPEQGGLKKNMDTPVAEVGANANPTDVKAGPVSQKDQLKDYEAQIERFKKEGAAGQVRLDGSIRAYNSTVGDMVANGDEQTPQADPAKVGSETKPKREIDAEDELKFGLAAAKKSELEQAGDLNPEGTANNFVNTLYEPFKEAGTPGSYNKTIENVAKVRQEVFNLTAGDRELRSELTGKLQQAAFGIGVKFLQDPESVNQSAARGMTPATSLGLDYIKVTDPSKYDTYVKQLGVTNLDSEAKYGQDLVAVEAEQQGLDIMKYSIAKLNAEVGDDPAKKEKLKGWIDYVKSTEDSQIKRYPRVVNTIIDKTLQELDKPMTSDAQRAAIGIYDWTGDAIAKGANAVVAAFVGDDEAIANDLRVKGKVDTDASYLTYQTQDQSLFNRPVITTAKDEVKKAIAEVNAMDISNEEKYKRKFQIVKDARAKGDIYTILNPNTSKVNLTAKTVMSTIVSTLPQIAGSIGMTFATGGFGATTTAGQLANLAVVTGMQSFGARYEQAVMEGNKDPYFQATTGTLIDMATEMGGNNIAQIKRMLGAGAAAKAISKMSAADIARVISTKPAVWKNIGKGIVTGLKDNLTETAEEVVAQLGDNLRQDKPIDNGLIDTGLSMAIGTLPLLVTGLPGHVRSANIGDKLMLYSAGVNAQEVFAKIDEHYKSGEISLAESDRRKAAVNKMTEIIPTIPLANRNGEPLSDMDRATYAYNEYVKQTAKEGAKTLPSRQADELKAVAEEADINNANIIDGITDPELSKIETQLPENSKVEVDRLKKLDAEVEDGATLNIDGTKYTGGGLVVPVASRNVKQSELTPELLSEFAAEHRDKFGADNVKIGLYKFPGQDMVSIDLNIVVDPAHREAALEFGRMAGQESLFDLSTFENVKTGADGSNPLSFTPAQFKEIGKALSNGQVPNVFKNQYADELLAELLGTEDVSDNIANIQQALESTGVRVQTLKGEEFAAAAEAVGAQASDSGFFVGEDGSIVFNGDAMDNRTVFHEGTHPVINIIRNTNPELYGKILSGLNEAAATNEGVASTVNWARENYDGSSTQEDESVVETIAAVADGTIDLDSIPKSLKQNIIDFINQVAKVFGFDQVLNDTDIEAFKKLANQIADALRTGKDISSVVGKENVGEYQFDNTPSLPNGAPVQLRVSSKEDVAPVSVKESGHDLSFVKKEDLFDIQSLIKEISETGKKVWFWTADQLGRGNYFDNVINGDHYLDAGPSYALDPENRSKGVIWATGKGQGWIENNIKNSDYLFIVSGSPENSKLFNKRVGALISSRIEASINSKNKFATFKKKILSVSNLNSEGGMNSILKKYNSFEELFTGPDRKTFISQINDQKGKNTDLKKALEKFNAFVDPNSLRDGFYADNGFSMNDIMLVLKPTGFGGTSSHSTFENNVLGEVVGVPDKKINAYDILPEEVKKPVTGESQKNQLIAPYGSGIRSVQSRKSSDLVSEAGRSRFMTEDENGNYLFYHYSGRKLSKIDPSKFGSNLATGRDEKPGVGISMYYTQAGDQEQGVPGNFGYVVRVPKSQVYPFNADPLNLLPIAEKEFNKKFPGQAFDFNKQIGFVTKVAADRGYKMTVADWNIKGRKVLRAQTVEAMKPEWYRKERAGYSNVYDHNPAIEKYKPNSKKRVQRRIDAYHGSPYSFNKFNTGAIGTGEGNQAFGWGLYFTELHDIASKYAGMTGRNLNFFIDGKATSTLDINIGTVLNTADYESGEEMKKDALARISKSIEEVSDRITNQKNKINPNQGFISNLEESLGRLKSEHDKISGQEWVIEKNKKNLYHVSINKDKSEHNFLLWDTPVPKSQIEIALSNPQILDAVSFFLGETGEFEYDLTKEEAASILLDEYPVEVTGKVLYKMIKRGMDSATPDKDTSLALLEAGIEGVKYPAESVSRNMTSADARGFNYVVFDENAVSIEKHVQFSKSRIEQSKEFKLGAYVIRKKAEGASIQELVTGIASVMPSMKPQDIQKLVNNPEQWIRDQFPHLSTVMQDNLISRAAVTNITAARGPRSVNPAFSGLSVSQSDIDNATPKERGILEKIADNIGQFRRNFFDASKGLPDWVLAIKDFAQGQKNLEVAYAIQTINEVKKVAKEIGFTDWDLFNRALEAKVTPVDRRMSNSTEVAPFEVYRAVDGKPFSLQDSVLPMVLPDEIKALPGELIPLVFKMRGQIDSLTKDLVGMGYVTPEQAATLESNIGQYVNRAYRMYNEKGWKPEKAQISAAVKYFADTYIKELANDNAGVLTFDQVKSMAIEKAQQTVQAILDKKTNPYFNVGKADTRNTGILQERQDIPQVVRDLMGEYKDPGTRFAMTVGKQAALKASSEYLTNLRKLGMGTLFFEKNDPNRPVGHSVEIAGEGSDSKSPLNGLYTTPEVADAIDRMDPTYNDLTNLWMKVVGAVRWGKTVGSIVTQFKNFESNIGFAVMNGLIFTGKNGQALMGAAGYIKNQYTGKQIDDITAKVTQLGLVDQSVGMSELKSMLGSGDIHSIALGEVAGLGDKVKGAVKAPFAQANKAYRMGDDFWKVYSYLNEREQVADAMFDAKYDDLSEADQKTVDIEASERVKDTWPTYSRVWEGARYVSKRAPIFGNFISFTAESIRVLTNTIRIAAQDIASPDPKFKMLGARRMAGVVTYISIRAAITAAVASAAGVAASGIIGTLVGSDDEERRKKAIKAAAPVFLRTGDLLTIPTGKGKFTVYNMSSLDPYGLMFNTANALTEGRPGIFGKTMGAGPAAAAAEFFGGFLQPEMTFDAAWSVINNTNQKTGAPIVLDSDTGADAYVKVASYLWDQLEPSTVGTIQRFKNGNKLAESAALFGARPYEVDLHKSFSFALSDYAKEMENISREYNKVKYSQTATPEEKEKAQKLAEDRKSYQENKMHELYSNFLVAGADKAELDKAIRDRKPVKMTGFDKNTKKGIMTGKFNKDKFYK